MTSRYLAAGWALTYGVVALVWAVTGEGYPYGVNNDDIIHPLRAVPVGVGSAVFAVVLLGIGVLALAIAGREPVRPPRAVRAGLLGFGWATVAALVTVVPGAHLLAVAGYAPMLIIGAPFGWPPGVDYGVIFNWTTFNEVWAVVGALLVARALARWQRPAGVDRRGPVRWGTAVTYVAAAIPAVYAATRLAWAAGLPLGVDADVVDDPLVATIAAGLGGFALVGTVLTIGLVRPWGERFPRWMVGLAGRPVPVRLATIPATVVAVGVAAASTGFLTGGKALDLIGDGSLAVLPIVLWPLWSVTLGLAAYAYHRRRHAAPVDQAGREALTAVSTSVAASPNVASVSVESSTNGRSH